MKKYIKRIAAALCAGIMLADIGGTAAFAEENGQNIPDITIPSGDSLEKFIHDTDDALRDVDENSPSTAAAVFQGDEILYEAYRGCADIEAGIPADENTVYEWGSITKTLTWVSVMQLWEQGKIDLDKDIREYLPEGFFHHLSYDDKITMTDLMNHRGGWCETTHALFVDDESELRSLGDALQEIEPAQTFRPGEVTAYSNYGAAVAGYIVERISGMDYCDYVRQNIFEPLGMEHTAIGPDHSDNEWVLEQRRQLRSYKSTLSGEYADIGHKLDFVTIWPAGSATGTLKDLVTYTQAFVDDDAPLFRNRETQEFMLSGSSFYGESDVPSCCHGLWPMERGVRTYGHSGGTTACRTDMEFDPVTKTGVVIMQNSISGNYAITTIPQAFFGELEPGKYGEPAGKADMSGHYVLSRSIHSGMFKFYGAMNTAILNNNFYDLGNGLMQLKTEDGKAAELHGLSEYEGRKIMQAVSIDAIFDRFFIPKLLLFAGYIFAAVISAYILLVKIKLVKYNRYKKFKGSAVITVSEILKIVSLLILMISTGFAISNYLSLSDALRVLTGVTQMICMAVFAASAAVSCAGLAKKSESRLITLGYAANIAGSVISIAAILFFEMYKFWGC